MGPKENISEPLEAKMKRNLLARSCHKSDFLSYCSHCSQALAPCLNVIKKQFHYGSVKSDTSHMHFFALGWSGEQKHNTLKSEDASKIT